jgi:hypothetical protein
MPLIIHHTAYVVMWSEFLTANPEVRFRFSAPPDFLSSSGSGTGSTEPLWGYLRSYLKEKLRLRSRKLRLTTVGDPPRWPRNTPLSAKVGTKFRRQVAVAQSARFACRLRVTEFVLIWIIHQELWGWGYKVEGKLRLVMREQKSLNTIALHDSVKHMEKLLTPKPGWRQITCRRSRERITRN